MEVRLDAFSSADYNVKDWLNHQFLSIDAATAFEPTRAPKAPGEAADKDQAGTETMTQRLTTQLHILATNAQQGNDRIKARFRHQAAQITRDIAALTRLISDTQNRMAQLSAQVDAQKPTAQAVERLVHIDTARQRLQQSVQALDHLRSYTDLPQKINTLLDKGDLVQAWRLVDGIIDEAQKRKDACADGTGTVGVDLEQVEQYREQVEAAAMVRLEAAIREHDAEAMAPVSKLLALRGDHGKKRVEQAYIDIRSNVGLEKLRPAVSGLASGSGDDIDELVGMVADLMAQERIFIDATEMMQTSSGLLAEQLLTVYIEAIQPAVAAKVAELEQLENTHGTTSNGEEEEAAGVIGLYQTLVRFYNDVSETLLGTQGGGLSVGESTDDNARSVFLAQPIPQSLHLLFDPFVQYMRSGLADQHVAAIRRGSLDRLQRVADPGASSDAVFAREAPECILEVFFDVDRALSRVFAFVPATALHPAVGKIAALVTEVASLVAHRLDGIAGSCGMPSMADLMEVLLSAQPVVSGAIYGPLASEEKAEAVASIVGVSVASRLFDQCATALRASVGRRWEEELLLLRTRTASAAMDDMVVVQLGALMESCATAAEMQGTVVARLLSMEVPGIEAIGEALAMLGRCTSTALVFALAAPFSAPLGRIPELGAWHSDRASVSSMNIHIPVFSFSPSEEAVEVGEKMQILLPELEQVEAMDQHQEVMRDAHHHQLGAEELLQPLFAYVVAWIANKEEAAAGMQEPVPPMQAMLSLVLSVVLRCAASQICAIAPPLSTSGRGQLAADVDYIGSVVSSFATSPSEEFDAVQRCLDRGNGNSDSDMSDSVALTCAKMRALLGKEQQS